MELEQVNDDTLTSQRLTGRDWRGRARAVATALALSAILGTGVPAATDTVRADGDMCAGDPKFAVGRDTVSIVVSLPKVDAPLITAANPVVVTINAPSGYTSRQVSYSGPFAETAQFTYTGAGVNANGIAMLNIKVKAPNLAGVAAYPVAVTASSSQETVTVTGTSGTSVNTNLSVRP